MSSPQSARECVDFLAELLETVDSYDQESLDELGLEQPGLSQVRTFEDVGMLSLDKGLVLTFEDGRQFQVVVKESTR